MLHEFYMDRLQFNYIVILIKLSEPEHIAKMSRTSNAKWDFSTQEGNFNKIHVLLQRQESEVKPQKKYNQEVRNFSEEDLYRHSPFLLKLAFSFLLWEGICELFICTYFHVPANTIQRFNMNQILKIQSKFNFKINYSHQMQQEICSSWYLW